MTVMAGVVFADARAVPQDETGAIDRALRIKGGIERWNAPGIYMVQSPDADRRAQGASGPAIAIMGDIRLDNREELIAALGSTPPDALSDKDIIALAYRKWGRGCAERLLGDFAFALWDEDERTMFCARDHFGVRPFYYRQGSGAFWFASAQRIVSRPGDRIDEGRMAGFLVGLDDSVVDTAFAEIRRLPPAHWLACRDGTVRIERYWALEPEAGAPGRDAAEQLRERFERSVSDRLRGTGQLGAMLSGGLDSSSIVSTVAHLRGGDPDFALKTYSYGYDNAPELDESPFIQAVLDRYPVTPGFVPMDDMAPLEGLHDLTADGDGPFFSHALPKTARILHHAHEAGSRIILDGHGGDEVISHGFGRLTELASQGRWLTLWRQLRGIGRLYNDNSTAAFVQYFTAFGLGARVKRRLIRSGLWRTPPAPLMNANDVLGHDLRRRTDVEARQQSWRQAYNQARRTEASSHLWNVSSPGVARAFELFAFLGERTDIDMRFPFFDTRLVSFTVGLPAKEKLNDGWSRSVMRRAMEGVLPETVRWRRDKIDFSPEIRRGLVRHHLPLLDDIMADRDGLGEYVDMGNLRQRYQRLLDDPDGIGGGELQPFLRCVMLAHWLRARQSTPEFETEPA